MLAGFVAGAVEVTLRRPPPLDRPLSVERDGERVLLMDGDTLIAEARPAQIDVVAPNAPAYEEAVAAAKRGLKDRPNLQYNSCFVCGAERDPGDGLCIFPGPMDGTRTMAATWEPDVTVANPDGVVPPEIVWSALDCPSGFPHFKPTGEVVLGRYAVKRMNPVRRDERYIVVGWPTGDDGRKLYSCSALYTDAGALCAAAKATWVRLQEPSSA